MKIDHRYLCPDHEGFGFWYLCADSPPLSPYDRGRAKILSKQVKEFIQFFSVAKTQHVESISPGLSTCWDHQIGTYEFQRMPDPAYRKMGRSNRGPGPTEWFRVGYG